jgi:hypothetical protein
VRHLRILGVCLAAVFAVAALAANSASAKGPEFGQCFAKEGGKYADSNCQTTAAKGAGKYEWRKSTAIANRKFEGKGGAGVLSSKIGFCVGGNQNVDTSLCKGEEKEENLPVKVECETESATGELSAKKPNEVKNVKVRFTGCSTLEGGVPCENTGVEEIETNTLKGTLGYINKAKKEVGLDLTPEKTHGEFALFTCFHGGLFTHVGADHDEKVGKIKEEPWYKGTGGDGIISPITPVDEMTPQMTQVYTENEAHENLPDKFEGGKLQVLEDRIDAREEENTNRSAWSAAGEAITNVNTQESGESLEIKA